MTDYEMYRGGMIQCMYAWENLGWGETPDGFYVYGTQKGIEDQMMFDKNGDLVYHFVNGVEYVGYDEYFYKEED